MEKIKGPTNPVALFEDHREMQVAHLSIGGNLSLCLTEPRAAMQSAVLAPAAPPSSSLPAVVRRWQIGVHALQAQAAGTKNWGGGGDVLPEALMVLPSAPHSQAGFPAEINNEDKPFPSPIFSGSRVVESIPKASRKFLRVVGGFTHLLSD